MNLKGRNFLTLKNFTPEEITYLLDLSAELKAKKKSGESHEYHKGKNVALIFEKTSTRTRCAFEVAAHDLGMGTTYLDPSGSQIGKKESIADTARVLGRMYDGIEYRGFGQEIVEELAKYAGVPVWNGLTNEYHPTQMLADMLTIREHFGKLKGISLVYMGDARYNMGNSLMIACAKLGMHFTACTTKKYFPNEELVALCRGWAEESGGTVTLTEDVKEGTKNADVIYTDVWVSMGEPDEVWEERIHDLTPYKVTAEVMRNAGENAIFLHCLPSFHDLSCMLPVMPIDPTSPIPSLSSGTKAMPIPVSRIFFGVLPTSSTSLPSLPMKRTLPALTGYRPVMASRSSFCPEPEMPATPSISPVYAVNDTESSRLIPSSSTHVRPSTMSFACGSGYLGLSILSVTAWPTIMSVSACGFVSAVSTVPMKRPFLNTVTLSETSMTSWSLCVMMMIALPSSFMLRRMPKSF